MRWRVLSAGFGNNTPNCYKGAPVGYGNPTAIPGWSYTGSVSGTGATVRTAVDAQGVVHSFANGVPRITNLGLLVEQAATNMLSEQCSRCKPIRHHHGGELDAQLLWNRIGCLDGWRDV